MITSPRGLRIALLALILGLAGFWATALDADLFIDRPFDYNGPRFASGNFVEAGMRGLSRPEGVLALTAFVFLAPAIAGAAARLARSLDDAFLDRLRALLLRRRRPIVLGAATLCALGTALVAFGVLRGAFVLDDERAYAFQADLFAHGRVALPAAPAALRDPMFLTSPVWTSKYPPGNSLVLALGALVGDARLVRPLLAFAFVVLMEAFVASMFGALAGVAAAVLAAASPYVWAQFATLLSFAPTALACAGFLAGVARSAETGRARPALFGGLALGALVITRPSDAALLVGPALVTLLVHAVRGFPGARLRFGAVALGAAAVAWILLWHDAAVTGSPFRFPWSLSVPFHPGFRQVYDSMKWEHTPLAAVSNLVVVLTRWDLWTLAFPGSVLLVLAGLLRRDRSPFDALLAAMLGGFLLAMTLVPSAGTWDCGSTYYFVCVPLTIALSVRGWQACVAWGARVADAPTRRTLAWGPVVGLALGWLTIAPLHFLALDALAGELRAPWDFIAHARPGDFLVALPPPLAREPVGWQMGYPYRIPTGPGTSARLFYPHDAAEAAAAIAALGPTLPVYSLRVDRDHGDPRAERVYTLVPYSAR